MVRRSWRHVALGIALLALIVVIGTIGYMLLGFGGLDATYQTVTTITTVGFREVEPLSSAGKVFTIVLILAGVGTALYTLTVGLELLVEGHFGLAMERRRMDKQIASFRGHVIVCGWGRVGKAIARELATARKPLVIIDSDPARLSGVSGLPYIVGDASDDDVLREAGIERASALVAAVATDAGNLVITLSGRALQPDLFIVARAREETSAAKLERAGANRVVNPQEIGGARMAAFLVQPHVTEFLDVVMHDREMELRLEELEIAADSPLANITVGEAHVRDRTGALILAIRDANGGFITSPGATTVMEPGHVLIAIGTSTQLDALEAAASRPGASA
jgi:voltage-gated potassium channel